MLSFMLMALDKRKKPLSNSLLWLTISAYHSVFIRARTGPYTLPYIVITHSSLLILCTEYLHLSISLRLLIQNTFTKPKKFNASVQFPQSNVQLYYHRFNELRIQETVAVDESKLGSWNEDMILEKSLPVKRVLRRRVIGYALIFSIMADWVDTSVSCNDKLDVRRHWLHPSNKSTHI